MKNILEVVTLNGLLRVEELEELLDELRGDIDLELTNLNALVDDELQEEFVDALEVRPGGVHLLLLVDTSLRETEVRFLHVGQGSEDVLLDHLHDLVQVRDDEVGHVFLVLEHLLELLDGIESLSL